jgi:hypothetical protein
MQNDKYIYIYNDDTPQHFLAEDPAMPKGSITFFFVIPEESTWLNGAFSYFVVIF